MYFRKAVRTIAWSSFWMTSHRVGFSAMLASSTGGKSPQSLPAFKVEPMGVAGL